MIAVSVHERVMVFSRYIGQLVVVNSLLSNDRNVIGSLQGVRNNALLIEIKGVNRWVPLSDDILLNDIKLLLKPLKKLTQKIIDTANSLPVQSFIIPYYQQLGFDMPVFIAPGSNHNCKYVHELGLADYRTFDEIEQETQHQHTAIAH
ncbi:hypothetical protein LJ707_07950 [Mucilaginibacter sp. UR6-1]|uniref:hypothetical protein n=1 Tax=Mucilaginibacter sp. UR6-1 TaxID=1435643 RepID=UPI001E63E1AB|nr:hypothetical protein [Mucilaginibacter sp. UR6-1]MCC8408859.1 hypothetical protein [Mucilaginibacter sp. UR6-1]